jgi:hypothetical protein
MTELAALPTHTVRAGVLEHEAVWRLEDDALVLQGGPAAAADSVLRFAYGDIVQLRLSFEPSRVDAARYRCDVRMRSGQQVAIMSTHYVGFADFENRAASYVPFVRALVVRVAPANPAARFRSGKNPLAFWAEHIFLAVVVAFLILVLISIGTSSLSDSSWSKLWMILGSIPLLIAYTRKNRPRPFKPGAIPQDVLPDLPDRS